jgi:biotin synthase
VKVRPCVFCGGQFTGDKLLTTPNPDVNDDMEMFEMLGLTSKPFTKVSQPTTVSCELSIYHFEKTKMVKTDIPDRNLEASAKESKFSHIKKLIRLTTEWVFYAMICKPNKSPFRN